MRALAAALALALSACATVPAPPAFGPETALYDPATDADAAVDEALAKAKLRGANTLIVLGANWCHDSRAFAAWSQQPANAQLLAERFETVFVDVGRPQTGEGRNAQILARFGMPAQVGTPLLLVVSPEGKVLNADSAASWRNAASRSDADIRAALSQYAQAPAPSSGEAR